MRLRLALLAVVGAAVGCNSPPPSSGGDTTHVTVYDTTHKPVAVYDTVRATAYDTTHRPVTIYDTTHRPVTIYDTTRRPVTVFDTTHRPVTIYDTARATVYDTTHRPVTVYDTAHRAVTVYDTTHRAVTVYDTTHKPVTVYDTTHITVTVTDTVHVRPVATGAVMIQLSGRDSLRVELVPLPKTNVIYGDIRMTVVKTLPDSAWPYAYIESARDSALVWAHMVDSVAALAHPDSTPGHISGIDTLVHNFPPGGPLWHNSEVLEYQRGDIHAGRGMQNYLSIGTGPPLASGSMPGIYYGPIYQAVEVSPANIALLTATIRRMLGTVP